MIFKKGVIIFFLFFYYISNCSSHECSNLPKYDFFNIDLFGAFTYLNQNENSFLEFITDKKNYFYELGVLSSFYFENNFSIHAQISKQGQENLDIDFLLLKYSNFINTQFSYVIDIGKIRSNIGFLSLGRLNPNYRINIILPQSLYSSNVKRFTSGGWGVSFTPTFIFENQWGVTADFLIFKPGKSSDETLVNTFYGPPVSGTYDTGIGFMIKTQLFSPIDTYNYYYLCVYATNGVFKPSGLPFSKNYDQDIMLNQIGFRYKINKLNWLIELRYLLTWNDFYEDIGDTKRQDTLGFNTMVRYWFNKKIVATLFGYSYWTDKAGDWDGQKKSELLGTNKYAHIQHDFYTTLTYKFNKNINFKLEYHKMLGTAVVNGESNDMLTLPNNWDIVALQMCFNF